jgi:hypothetical protein
MRAIYALCTRTTSRNCRGYNNVLAQHDNVLVERFKRSGVSILGKTNTPEFGLQAIPLGPRHSGDARRDPRNRHWRAVRCPPVMEPYLDVSQRTSRCTSATSLPPAQVGDVRAIALVAAI